MRPFKGPSAQAPLRALRGPSGALKGIIRAVGILNGLLTLSRDSYRFYKTLEGVFKEMNVVSLLFGSQARRRFYLAMGVNGRFRWSPALKRIVLTGPWAKHVVLPDPWDGSFTWPPK